MNWGIIGCGWIAANFAESIAVLDGAKLLACASKTESRAKAFAEANNVEQWYANYDELLADDQVEIVYVATTHNFHYENVIQCLEAGKHVLCEKAFTINAPQSRHLVELAKSKGLFLMEAMWTRFLPATKALMAALNEGVIGDVTFLKADFAIMPGNNLEGRLYNKDLAGGALLDLGVYPLSFSHMVFGKEPIHIHAEGTKTVTGVDARSSFQLDFGQGKGAQLSCNIDFYPCQEAIIGGSEGWIKVPEFFCAQSYILYKDGKETVVECPYTASGKYHEAEEAERCIREGKLESDLWPLSKTIEIMEEMDAIRRQTDLVYPEDMEALSKS